MKMKAWCQGIVGARWFEPFIITMILINAAVLGLETVPALESRYGELMLMVNRLVLLVFVLEATIKIIAVAPQYKRYFGDGWNLFDFSIVVLSLLPATGEFAMIARMARLLRVLRLISTLPELRLIVAHFGALFAWSRSCYFAISNHFLYVCRCWVPSTARA